MKIRILTTSPNRGAPPRAAALAIAGLLLACGGSSPAQPGADSLSAQVAGRRPARVQAVPSSRDPIDESRRTAIVRAAEDVAPAVVSVNVQRVQEVRRRGFFDSFLMSPQRSRLVAGLGSGFIFDASGLVMTNDHVVTGAERIMVTLPDGRDFEAELLGTDPLTDIAVLRIESPDPLPSVALGTSDGMLIGEWALAIGNPFGNLISNAEPTVTAGVVSALRRHIVPDADDTGFYLGMIQTDAAINPGNSGGPLVNALGEVVGVNASIFTRSGGSEGLGFAIPIDRALRIADDLVQKGSVDRAWLGIDVGPVEADEWGRTHGIQITRVSPDSPAAAERIQAGSRLLRINDVNLTGPLDYEAVMLELTAGSSVDLFVEGRNAPYRFEASSLPSRSAERMTIFGGLELVTLDPGIRAERRVRSEEGALIVSVSGQLGRQLGFQVDDVLLRINGVRTPTAQAAVDVLERLEQQRGRVRIEFERAGGYNVRDFTWR